MASWLSPDAADSRGFSAWARLPLLGALLLSFASWAPGSARAETSVQDPGPKAVLAALHADDGWVVHQLDGRGGVDIYRRRVPGLVNWVFKGVKDVDVDSTILFEAVIDIASHAGLSRDIPLTHSVVLHKEGNQIDFFQLLDSPAWTLAADRYWFCRAFIHRNVGGVKGHHLQTWQGIDPNLYPAQRDAVLAEHASAVLPPVNYGSWEIVPLSPGRSRMIYRVASDPGGRLPRAASNLVTGKTLPDNLLQFEAEGKRRMGR